MTVKKSNILFGLLLIYIGVEFLIHPVQYTYRVAFDLRGWLKWVASFTAIFPGIWIIFSAFSKGKLIQFYCPKCGKIEKLPEGKQYICSFCKVPMSKLEDFKDE